jgi:hypothetical protein
MSISVFDGAQKAGSSRRVIWTVLAATSLWLAPAIARAEPSDTDRATARALAREGYEAQKRGQYELAADRFRRAEAMVHAPTLLLGLARAQVGLGKLVEAQETYERIVHEPLPPSAPAPFAKAVDEAKHEGPALSARLAWVTLDVQAPDSAEVDLDGVPVSTAALRVKRACNPGEHVAKVSLAGYTSAEKTFSLGEGGVETVVLSITPLAEPPSPPPEHVEVAQSASPPTDTPSSLQMPIGVAVLVLGGAGLVVGGVTGGLALSKHSTLNGDCPGGHCQPEEASAVGTYRTLANVSTAATIAGAACAVTGITLILTAPKSGAPVTAFAGFQSVGIRGTF